MLIGHYHFKLMHSLGLPAQKPSHSSGMHLISNCIIDKDMILDSPLPLLLLNASVAMQWFAA